MVSLTGHRPAKTRLSGSDIEFADVSLRQELFPKKSEFALQGGKMSFQHPVGGPDGIMFIAFFCPWAFSGPKPGQFLSFPSHREAGLRPHGQRPLHLFSS